MYGYGESGGKFEDITISTARESVMDAVSYIKTKLKYKGLFLFGTSYGGSGILAALEDLNPKDISGLIFRSTILNYYAKTLRENSKEQLNNWRKRGYIDDHKGKLNYSFVEDMKNYQHIKYKKLSNFQTLYFHAGKDSKVLVSEINELKSKLDSNLELVIYPDSKHGIDLQEDRNDMLLKTKDFILKNNK
jgi:alpha-beta hydrolase superfamily lysophospholipase